MTRYNSSWHRRCSINVPSNRTRQPRRVAAMAAGLLLVMLAAATTRAQQLATDVVDPQERQRLYDELVREVDQLARPLGLLKKVVRLVRPTVVHIEADHDELDGNSRRRHVEEAGSGVIIRENGKFYVLTNRHVIKQTPLRQIDIKLFDGRWIRPTHVWTDPATDIAVLQVAEQDLIAARLGDSDRLEIGDFVLAVGSPFGLSHSVTYGIISARGRRDLKLGDESVRYQDFLQTDAAINPGNSGGPLVNLRGEVVGINTAIASSSGGSEGIGFAIPINMAMIVARQLIQQGRVERAFLGVRLDSTFDPAVARQLGLPRPVGARVSGVTPNSPAEKARLQVGDVILKYDGVTIEDDNDLVNRVSLTPVGKQVQLLVLRDGQTITLTVQLEPRSNFEN